MEGNEELEQSVRAVTIHFEDAAESPLGLDSAIDGKGLPLADLEKRVRDKIDKVEKSLSLACSTL